MKTIIDYMQEGNFSKSFHDPQGWEGPFPCIEIDRNKTAFGCLWADFFVLKPDGLYYYYCKPISEFDWAYLSRKLPDEYASLFCLITA